MAEISINDKTKLVGYLENRGVFSPGAHLYVRYFEGGVSCNVALVSNGNKSVIVKQALSRLKVAEIWECDPNRMIIEYNALEVYARLTPGSVPSPVFYDHEQYIMCREAAPEECPMWKTNLLEGVLDFRIARKAIEALLTVHNGTAGDGNVRETFRAVDIFYNLRINPYIEFTVLKFPDLKALADRAIEMLLSVKTALVHGDYSPKNILVSHDKIFVLDMEVAHYGHPAFDTAFFANHFLLKSVKNKQWAASYLNMLEYMKNIYFNGATCTDAAQLEKDTVFILGFLLLARVDGKSPAEYITGEKDKELVRNIAGIILNDKISSFDEVIGLVKARIDKTKTKEKIYETL
jgi:hypothetical protein